MPLPLERPLKEIYSEFEIQNNESKEMTKNQERYIRNLISRLINSKNPDPDQILEKIRELLPEQKNIEKISDLTNQEIKNLFFILHSQVLINEEEIESLKPLYFLRRENRFDFEHISRLTKKEITNVGQLTLRQFKYLMKNPSRFYIVPKEMPEICTEDFEIGYQISKYCEGDRMKYIKFFSLMMLDYDEIDMDSLKVLLEKKISSLQGEVRFEIYRTCNGFHVFETSREWNYESEDTFKFMHFMQCDKFYSLFVNKFGFKVRLTLKKDRNESFPLASFCFAMGSAERDPAVDRYMQIHDRLINGQNPEIDPSEIIYPFQGEDQGFYSSFVKIIEEEWSRTESNEDNDLLKSAAFRAYLLNQNYLTKFEAVKFFSNSIKSHIIKPQRLIANHPDYYIACDMATSTYYICYKNLMMIDIDIYKGMEHIVDDKMHFKGCKEGDFFQIYLSQGGYHIFLLSEEKTYGTDESIQKMLDMNCDFYYVLYSYIRGYSVRLNKKEKEKNGMIKGLYAFKGIMGNPDNGIEKLVSLMDMHIELTDLFKDVKPSGMYGG